MTHTTTWPELKDETIADKLYYNYNKLKKIYPIELKFNTFFNAILGNIIINSTHFSNKTDERFQLYNAYISKELPQIGNHHSKDLNEFIKIISNSLSIEVPTPTYKTSLSTFSKIEDLINKIRNFESINKILGKLYEKIITKKESGAYYTDDETTSYIVENSVIPTIIKKWQEQDVDLSRNILSSHSSIDEFIIEIVNKNSSLCNLTKLIKDNQNNILLNVLEELKIIDISCGSGSFIFSSIELINKIYSYIGSYKEKANNFNRIVQNNVYGVDIDTEAIEILKFRLCIESIRQEEYDQTQLIKSFENFIVGDSLNERICHQNKIETNVFDNKNIDSIIKTGGFDVAIGNPPYLEYKKKYQKYNVEKLISKNCNNLYAYFLEINFNIIKPNGHLGVIVPISFISTKRMTPIRNLLSTNCNYQFIASFADRPACIFNGVHQKLNIIIQNKNTINPQNEIFTSNYIHWYNNERKHLYNNIKYVKNPFINQFFIFKIGNQTDINIIKKMTNQSNISLIDTQKKHGEFKVWLNMRMTFWCKSFTFEHFSKEYKSFFFDDFNKALIFSAFLNCNIFFFFWETISDVWHITHKDLDSIRFNMENLSQTDIEKIKSTYLKLENNLILNKKRINTKQTEFEYQHKYDKILMDQLDQIFANCIGLTDEELEYIRKYQLSFRLNDELKNYINYKMNTK